MQRTYTASTSDGDEKIVPKKPRLGAIRSLSIQHNATKLLDGLLYIGGNDCVNDLLVLQTMDITHIVNCTRETPNYFTEHFEYLQIPINDDPDVNIDMYFEEICTFIHKAIENKMACMVHCSHGMSRSATIVLAYLMQYKEMTLLQALTYLRSLRRVVSPNIGFMQQLLTLELSIYQVNSLDLQEYKKDRFAPVQDLAMVPILSTQDNECQLLATPTDPEFNRVDSIRPSSKKKCLVPFISVIFLVSVIIGIIFAVKSNNSSSHKAPSSNVQINTMPPTCTVKSPKERIVVFWGSEVDGCSLIPSGVTHVNIGFALVQNGIVVPTFQGNKATLLNCIAALHTKCIRVLASIGGATNVDQIANVNDPNAFANSALALIQEYGLDGVDIDNEAVGTQYSAEKDIAMMTALHTTIKAKDPNYLITYDTLVFEGVNSFCSDTTRASYSRCFTSGLVPLVDWFNIMAYNVYSDSATAAAFYANATQSTFEEWFNIHLNGDLTKATIGICVGSGCGYGDGPSNSIISSWTTFAKNHGGMMIYAGSTDNNFIITKSIISILQ
ncbi:carbohydrate-binding protein [Thraustotheca clavata]|uniref:protein-tyrosine-phosphatase n=1 Tax=Thraustotheca clavata TaxID=74557 RepID=A0A1V9YRT3_9STRA|nr:carbohydrate-binding protein [Thraustotheca clavata]